MLDINLFLIEKRGDPNIIWEAQRRRLKDVSLVDRIIFLHKQWKTRQFELEQAKKGKNELKRKIRNLKMADLDATEKIMELEDLKKEIPAKEGKVNALKKELNKSLLLIGNLVHDNVPMDNNEANNSVVRTSGECRPIGRLINHVDLVNKLQLANFEKASKVAGGGGVCYLKTEGYMLKDALVSFGLALLQKGGYKRVKPPTFMVKETIGRCAQLSQLDEELYKLVRGGGGDVDEEGDANETHLVSTCKQSLYALHVDETISPESLPISYAGSCTCFRKEDLSNGGIDTLGLFGARKYEEVHQFCITSPNDNKSWEMHEEMLRNAEDFYNALGIPYRVVNVVSGALSREAAKTYKIEGWFPASQTYKELASCSNNTDYVARRLGIAYGQKNDVKTKQHKNDVKTKQQFVHQLDCTLTSTHKTMCCILENYQTKDGVVVPEALRPFMMNEKDFLPFRK